MTGLANKGDGGSPVREYKKSERKTGTSECLRWEQRRKYSWNSRPPDSGLFLFRPYLSQRASLFVLLLKGAPEGSAIRRGRMNAVAKEGRFEFTSRVPSKAKIDRDPRTVVAKRLGCSSVGL